MYRHCDLHSYIGYCYKTTTPKMRQKAFSIVPYLSRIRLVNGYKKTKIGHSPYSLPIHRIRRCTKREYSLYSQRIIRLCHIDARWFHYQKVVSCACTNTCTNRCSTAQKVPCIVLRFPNKLKFIGGVLIKQMYFLFAVQRQYIFFIYANISAILFILLCNVGKLGRLSKKQK